MIVGETDNERRDREEKADYRRRINQGQRVYVDQFSSPVDWELIKKLLRSKRNEA